MKILVTGGAGFIGSHIVDRYVQEGHEVVIIDDLSTGKIQNINERAIFYKTDIRDFEQVRKIIRSHSIELISHHAAQLDVRFSVTHPELDAGTNILGLINILEAFKESCAVSKKIVYISSGGCIYGNAPCPIREDALITPESQYGASKASGEFYLHVYHKLYGIDFTVLRYSNVYGPRQDPTGEAGVIAIFIGNLLREKTCRIFGSGEQVRDYIFVGDVVNANSAAISSGSGQAFNIGTGRPTSVNELYALLSRISSEKPREPEYLPERPGELFKNYLDCRKAEQFLDWKPETSLEEGLRLTHDYFRKDME